VHAVALTAEVRVTDQSDVPRLSHGMPPLRMTTCSG
jgi:hypothetical protein